MQGIFDKELKIKIKNLIVNYNYGTGELIYKKLAVSKYRKNGYLTCDDKDRSIGIVFMSDDKRTNRFGNAEILFFRELKNEFGTWRILKIKKGYLPFKRLEEILQNQNEFVCVTDARIR